MFTQAHQSFWDAARRALGDKGGTQALIEALLLHRTHPAAAVAAAMREASMTGRYNADMLAVTARAHATPPTPTTRIVLPHNVPDGSATRPAPSLAGYDQLLEGELG